MDEAQAEEIVKSRRKPMHGNDGEFVGREWIDPKSIATTTFRRGVVAKLSRDSQLQNDGNIALAEISLTEALDGIESFEGIFEVDHIGIWYYDGDGHIEDPVWRQGVIPWRHIAGIRLHQIS